MTDTQEILRRIAALRARLDKAHGLVEEADAAAGADAARGATLAAAEVAGKVEKGERDARRIDAALRPLLSDEAPLPPRLTARAMRLLHQGRGLLHSLRGLSEHRALRGSEATPRARLHRETLAMLETVLRTIQAFPPAPSPQLRLCEGLEAVLDVVAERVKILESACRSANADLDRVDHLADLFRKLAAGQAIRGRDWLGLTEEVWTRARHGEALRLMHAGADDVFRFVAAHGLNTAHVLARIIVQESQWQSTWHECLMAALLHDVGMVHVAGELIARPGPWSDAERRRVERHPSLGSEMLARVFPPGGIIVETAQDHHERVDGAGYPNGKGELQLSAFTRLVAVCDVYAALCSGRPHRAARDTRTALTDTLLLADRGSLDKQQAEKLLRLSFYPPGSVVELADGAAGLVVATHAGERGLLNPARPILLLLTESQGEPLAAPRLLDLLQEEDRSILRTLPAEARLPLLGRHFPEAA